MQYFDSFNSRVHVENDLQSGGGGIIYFFSILCNVNYNFFSRTFIYEVQNPILFFHMICIYIKQGYIRKETLIFFCNAYDVLKICFSFQDEISISLKDISKADSDYPDGFWFLLSDWLMSSASCFLTELIFLPCSKTSHYLGNESVVLFIVPRHINSCSVKTGTQLIFINIIA